MSLHKRDTRKNVFMTNKEKVAFATLIENGNHLELSDVLVVFSNALAYTKICYSDGQCPDAYTMRRDAYMSIWAGKFEAYFFAKEYQ